ncbi:MULTISPECIES: hemolysin family protein [unclassified Coleofasciculus]|uniref:hemolysin family protein n=1 Tax=unclassified Coleofasciculus TaxID=2692782 RepID=UPI00188265E2|nr:MULTISPECIES: hemolysin family protein [unclassified Coleofasciculus]MBE9129440.1 HlyC/CorC family transporter [Coleofasciculus sp. LEGE 07081]MBE9148706.1 HlyC/CorC family transporter [Coleofasciculus sp. LEGE 07092]
MVTNLMVLLTASASTNLTSQDILLRLLSVLLLITINAFFVTAEFSMVSVRRSRINQLVDAGDVQARTVQVLQRSIDRLLSTTQLGITLSSLALGWIGESTMAVLVGALLVKLPLSPELNALIAHSLAIPVAFLLIAYLQIVLGELCPKSVALLYSEQLARFLGPPSVAIARFFNPFIWVLNQSTRLLLRLAGIQYTGQSWYNQVTPEELQLIITTERESTGLEAEERELLNNVFEFGEVVAAEVMVPRTSIEAIPSTATFQTLLEEIADTNHSRYPVTGESLDDIRGIIYFKELAQPLSQGKLTLETSIDLWIRPARFVPELTPLSELLPLMQRSHLAMVMVVDEFGGTAGLVTLKDLVAEIIGDNAEPESTEELPLQILDEQTFLVQAQMDLEEVNELLDLNFPVTDEYQTLGGFLLYQFQKIPVQGETLKHDNLELTVVSAEGPRLHQIRIHRQESPVSPLGEPSALDIVSVPTPTEDTLTNTTLQDTNNPLSKNINQDFDIHQDSSSE